MFSAELKINGQLIGCLYGRNLGERANGEYRYEYQYYRLGEDLMSGYIHYKRNDGLECLVGRILSGLEDHRAECKIIGCGGFKHCKDRSFDRNRADCKECKEDAYQGIEEVTNAKIRSNACNCI